MRVDLVATFHASEVQMIQIFLTSKFQWKKWRLKQKKLESYRELPIPFDQRLLSHESHTISPCVSSKHDWAHHEEDTRGSRERCDRTRKIFYLRRVRGGDQVAKGFRARTAIMQQHFFLSFLSFRRAIYSRISHERTCVRATTWDANVSERVRIIRGYVRLPGNANMSHM